MTESKEGARRTSRKKAPLYPEPPSTASQVDSRAFLARLLGKSPSEVLSRITTGDPLDLQQVCVLRLRDQALLIDPDRLLEKAMAHVAFAASRTEEVDAVPEWLLGQVDVAIGSILTEDREQELQAPGCPPPNRMHYRFIHLAFATEPGLVRSAAVQFNRLPISARRGFFRLLVDGLPVDECVRELGTTREELRLGTLEALRALGHLKPGEVVGSRSRKRRKLP